MRLERASNYTLAPFAATCRVFKRALRLTEGKISRWTAVIVLSLYWLIAFMLPVGDSRPLSATQAASVGHHYGLLSFEVSHLPDKWLHRVYTALPWTSTSDSDRQAELEQYLALAPRIRSAQSRLLQASSQPSPDPSQVAAIQRELDALLKERDAIRNGVEEYLESAISTELRRLGFGVFGDMVWPPVDFRLDNPPSVLVTSPRDRIARRETVLIDPDIPAQDMERIEQALLEDYNLSAAVIRTGGLASYPTVIPSSLDLLPLLQVAVHEWLHTYLIFHPLGRSFFSGGEMVTINETLANLFGDEVGGKVWADLTGNPPPVMEPPAVPGEEPPLEPGEFDYFRFMRETRLRADELLTEGDIEGAEAWMEQRRVELRGHGYIIRKINQAFFAFTGSYADNPASVSPVARQIWEIRSQVDGPGEVVKALRSLSSYAEFEAVLRERGIAVGG